MRLVRVVLVGVGLLLAACVGLIGIGLLLPDVPISTTPAATAVATGQVVGMASAPATATSFPRPSPTPPAPTATLAPPSPTATPASTATVAPTPTPAISPAERAYAAAIQAQSEALATSLRHFGQLAAASRPSDAAWRRELVVVLVRWRVTHEEARAMAPPARYRVFHARYVASLAELSAAADDVAWAIDHSASQAGVARMERAGERIQLADRLLAEAMQVFQRAGP